MSVDHEQFIIGETNTRVTLPFSKEREYKELQMQLGEWKVRYLDAEILLPNNISQQAIELLHTWQEVSPKEDTWVQRHVGVPTLIARIDATFTSNGLQLYEIEDRPQGAGMASVLNPEFKTRLQEVRKTWPDIRAVVSPQRRGTDDALWLDVVQDPKPDDLLLVRAEPWEEEFHRFQRQSISTVKTEGDKAYGEKMGLWEKIYSPNDVDWELPQVVKPTQGSKAKDVMVWLPKKEVYGQKVSNGVFTKTRISATIEAQNGDGMYIQPFHPPIPIAINGDMHWMALRTFFGFDTQKQEWVSIGGLTSIRKNMIIHGASDTIFSPINISQ